MKTFLILLFTSLAFSSCNNQKNDPKENWTKLLDENLTQWDKYLSYKYSDSYDGSIPVNHTGGVMTPIGLNKYGYDVFSMKMTNNEPVLRISGEIYGCIITKKEYENYHLKLKLKWGNNVYPPRLTKGKDSGLLYHSFGENGADYWRSWMFSHEFQVMKGRMGDYWTIGPTTMEIKAIPEEWIMNTIANENFSFLEIRDTTKGYGFCSRSADYESKEGEWTTLELICFEDKSLHIVNGEVVMILKNSRYIDGGTEVPLQKGKIQIQSEAAEVFYKDIEITSLESLPTEYAKYYE